MEFQTINLDIIDPNPNQPREDFGDNTLQELVDSIKQVGVLVPLLTRPLNGRYEIVHGERRWRAAKMAGLKEVPAQVRPLTDTEAFIISLNENLQRQNLNPIEEAKAYQWLQDQGYSQVKIGEIIGKTQQYVASRLVLLALPPGVKEKITTHVVSPSHGEILASLQSTKLATEFVKHIEKDKLTVRQLEHAIEKHKRLDDIMARAEAEKLSIRSSKIDISPSGNIKTEYEWRLDFDLKQQEESRAVKEQGFFIGNWLGSMPRLESNDFDLVTELEVMNAQKFRRFWSDFDIYWGLEFERTQLPKEGDLGREYGCIGYGGDRYGINYFLPDGRWGWVDFPQEMVNNQFKVVRRRVFVPCRIPWDEYAKLLAVLSGGFYIIGLLNTYIKYTWEQNGMHHTFHTDALISVSALLDALKSDIEKINSLQSWQDLRSAFYPRDKDLDFRITLDHRPDIFEHIRHLAKTMSPKRRRLVARELIASAGRSNIDITGFVNKGAGNVKAENHGGTFVPS